MSHITIFHTNDLHNRLSQEKAVKLRQLKESVPNSILLDAGDAIRAGNVFVSITGEPVLELMSIAGYDAMTLGNREFHFLAPAFRSKIGSAKFPILCANLHSTGSAEMPVVPSINLYVGSFRVAVFGLSVPMITSRMFISHISDYIFEDPISAAARIVPALRSEADLVVALTHIGLRRDRFLADSVPGIDVIVGGHSHSILSEPEMIGFTAIVQAGSHAHSVGKTVIEPGVSVQSELIDL